MEKATNGLFLIYKIVLVLLIFSSILLFILEGIDTSNTLIFYSNIILYSLLFLSSSIIFKVNKYTKGLNILMIIYFIFTKIFL